MDETVDTAVIVVGGSLVGLSAALFLSHWDVPVILLERHPGSSAHPRAIGYTSRTIELLRSAGVESALEGISWKNGPPRRIAVESLAGKWHGEQHWTKPGDGKPKASPVDFRAYSPVDGIAVAQDVIEPILRSRATELGAKLMLGYGVTGWDQDDSGVSATAVNSNTGRQIQVRAKYLVACDGGRSPIREKLGIERQGVGHVRTLRSILFRCPPIEKYLEHGYKQFSIEGRDDGFGGFLTTYGDGRWMLAWDIKDDTSTVVDETSQRDKVRKATGLPSLHDEDITLLATGEWDIGGHIADSFSSGRIFLAGDAAHTLPPNRGGYGANTGIADAHNLAWKLASVVGGHSRRELLDTYDAERRPVAQVRHDQIFARDDHRRAVLDREWPGKDVEILDDVAMEFGQIYRSEGIVLGAEDDEDSNGNGLPLAQKPEVWKGRPGIRAPHLVLRRRGTDEPCSTLDFFGKSWVVISKDESWQVEARDAAKVAGFPNFQFVCIGGDTVVEVEEGQFAKLFGLGASGAALVRPDGVIAWRVIEKPEEGRRESLEKALWRASFAVGSQSEG
ncbi:Tetracenomycin polyketide synthesis hydroxylase-like protein [Hapsidospora chrysogenum ATCC 11550]|uniref:Tetracenomycin polyketide synthesis hydroxylase-like protein n=1 Tax=Hapsidospora chrysogenum (strain ATCC 11550 / CBS 779.69 / DSM 880 / IAM 14645 / JCM 23072 / IMI 49137) TaxID=857340 RepID=A0A086TDP1_HAPC1|nr:Tetracenomycin polyketide synthesis hydroxylase-like protein [Hapsidospora chrysogenum ATCC 11550]